MRQIFLLILLFIVGQWLAKALRRAQTRADGGAGPQASRRGPRGGASGTGAGRTASLPEPMVRCAECGVHAPRSESVLASGQSFCCDQHARRYAARTTGDERQDRAAR